MHGISLQLKV